jgi:peptidoglycan/LPS O-acetylase OafA/YrhL
VLLPVARNGNYGVTMFFVVSGYLITSTTLLHHGSLGHVDLRSFVPRGAMPEVYKLPAMGFFVAASVVVAWVLRGSVRSR